MLIGGEKNMDEMMVNVVAANVTVDGSVSSTGSSFSSFETTRRSLLGETANLSDDNEININDEIIKSMFSNILERLDN